MAKRYNLAIVNNDETEAKEKIEALKLDAALTMTLLKLDYEGTVFLRLHTRTKNKKQQQIKLNLLRYRYNNTGNNNYSLFSIS
jgi:hypothetical protein